MFRTAPLSISGVYHCAHSNSTCICHIFLLTYTIAVCTQRTQELSETCRDSFQNKFEKSVHLKAVSLRAWSGPEGSRKLRFPAFMTTAQDGVSLSALSTGRIYPPGNSPGTHFCWRLSRPQGHSAIRRIMSMKNSNDTIGDRTSDLPICSAVS
jgi:hypothetical protein